MTKRCTKCGTSRAIECFTRDRTRSDGRHPHCRSCRRVYGRVWATNSPKRAAYLTAWKNANRETVRGYSVAFRQRHAARLADRRRELYAANAAQRRAYHQEWRRRNREAYLAYRREYERLKRAKLRASQVIAFTQKQLAQRLSMFIGCWICGSEWAQVDHVKPVARGGPHMLANLRPICAPCNHRKKARWPLDLEFLAALAMTAEPKEG